MEKGVCAPSTARLNSTARISSTSTYSRRSWPSSSVSPGIKEPSVESGLNDWRRSFAPVNDGPRGLVTGATTLSRDDD